MPLQLPRWTLFLAPPESTGDSRDDRKCDRELFQPRQADEPSSHKGEPDLLGTVLPGQWELRRRIGVGGMGEVYAATCLADRFPYAVKVLAQKFVNNPIMLARFQHECWVLRSVAHPHIVKAHSFFEDRGERFYYSMELLEGDSLIDLVKRRPLELARALPIALQLCSAVTTLHDLGVIHRDLKPANVFIIREAGKDHVKLLDLGICKLTPRWYAKVDLRTRPELRIRTQAGIVMGTPGYIGPLSDDRDDLEAGVLRDVFGLGATLFRIVVGRTPYKTSPPQEGDDPNWTAEDDKRIPFVLENVLRKAIAVDPAVRYSSIESLRDELEQAAMELGVIPFVPEKPPATPGLISASTSTPAPIELKELLRVPTGAEAPPELPCVSTATEAPPKLRVPTGAEAPPELPCGPTASKGPPLPEDPTPHAGVAGDTDPTTSKGSRVGRGRQHLATVLVVLVMLLGVYVALDLIGHLSDRDKPTGQGAAVIADQPDRAGADSALESRGPELADPMVKPVSKAMVAADDAGSRAAHAPTPLATKDLGSSPLDDPASAPSTPRATSRSRLTPKAFRKVAASRQTALTLCARALRGKTNVDVVVRISAEGSIADLRLEPDVSFLAASCVDEAFEPLHFPASESSSTHRWPLSRAAKAERE